MCCISKNNLFRLTKLTDFWARVLLQQLQYITCVLICDLVIETERFEKFFWGHIIFLVLQTHF